MSGSTAVVHLVRRSNTLEPFAEFMREYERYDAGHDHELVLAYKGFESAEELAPFRERADGHSPRELHLTDYGVDLEVFLTAARELRYRRLCFMNSWTTPLTAGWLDVLARALDQPNAGVAGATGSWASHRSAWLGTLHLPNGYRGELRDLRPMIDAMQAVDREPPPTPMRRLARAARGVPVALCCHPGFPSPHVRNTAFVIERELLLSLRSGRVPTKPASYRLESGHRSWTTQLIERGLVPFVVGRDSGPLAPEQWPEADIFWQGAQADLIAADRKTVAYEGAAPAVREVFARYAWGPRARSS